MPQKYLNKILNAPVYDVAIESPLDAAPGLSVRIGNRVLIKREDLQPVFSFKLRGAYNKLVNLPEAARKKGVIAASAGNHAQGVALSAARMKVSATIVMPQTTPEIKVSAVRKWGAKVILHGDDFASAYARVLEIIEKKGLTLMHPFDDPDVIAGQGTVGMEILRQHMGDIHAIFLPIGGGGLAAGVASYVKTIRPEIKIIGVEAVDSASMYYTLKKGRRDATRNTSPAASPARRQRTGRRGTWPRREVRNGGRISWQHTVAGAPNRARDHLSRCVWCYITLVNCIR